jgi:hypothetical protein
MTGVALVRGPSGIPVNGNLSRASYSVALWVKIVGDARR